MSELVRVLNDEGNRIFREYLDRLRAGATETPPKGLLTSALTSDPFEPEVSVDDGPFASREQLGRYLVERFAVAETRVISRNAGLWNWLALFYFDDLCPANASGNRKPLAPSHYVLEGQFAHNRYYRHLVRFVWLSVLVHGDDARVLLASSGKGASGIGQWGELSEQLGAYQGVFGSKTAVGVAARLFLDDAGGLVRGAASPSGQGSVRRFATVLKQFLLTYDLRTATIDAALGLLPREFEKFLREYERRLRVRPAIVSAPARAVAA